MWQVGDGIACSMGDERRVADGALRGKFKLELHEAVSRAKAAPSTVSEVA